MVGDGLFLRLMRIRVLLLASEFQAPAAVLDKDQYRSLV